MATLAPAALVAPSGFVTPVATSVAQQTSLPARDPTPVPTSVPTPLPIPDSKQVATSVFIPTPTPTATPEPTASPTPTGTLEPTATPAGTVGGQAGVSGSEGDDESDGASGADGAEPDACALGLPDDTLPFAIEGSWSTECVYPHELDDVRDGDRYYRYVEFETPSGDAWEAALESSEDTVLVLFEWDAASESWALVEMNDDIQQDNTNSRIEWTSVAGQRYLLDVTTYEATTLGDFTLTVDATAGGTQN